MHFEAKNVATLHGNPPAPASDVAPEDDEPAPEELELDRCPPDEVEPEDEPLDVTAPEDELPPPGGAPPEPEDEAAPDELDPVADPPMVVEPLDDPAPEEDALEPEALPDAVAGAPPGVQLPRLPEPWVGDCALHDAMAANGSANAMMPATFFMGSSESSGCVFTNRADVQAADIPGQFAYP